MRGVEGRWWQREAGGQTWGFVFSIAGGGAEHVLISHNATHYVISHYALCQCFTSSYSFPPFLSPPVASALYPESRVKGGWGAEGRRDCLSYFCTDEPEAAANLPLRTSAKSPQESCAWLEKGKHKAKGIQTKAYKRMHRINITMNMLTNASQRKNTNIMMTHGQKPVYACCFNGGKHTEHTHCKKMLH